MRRCTIWKFFGDYACFDFTNMAKIGKGYAGDRKFKAAFEHIQLLGRSPLEKIRKLSSSVAMLSDLSVSAAHIMPESRTG